VSVFAWAGEGEPTPQWDLRLAGWTLAAPDLAGARIVLVDARPCASTIPFAHAALSANPGRCVFLGVECGAERTTLLRHRCGDALPEVTSLEELDERARRLWAALDSLPRRRELGPLTLDLLHRDARAGGRWLALHPREFGLVWRLADCPGEPVSRTRLLRDVWRMEFEPGTNSVEVHVSRLRTKLAAAGVRGLIETHEHGGYRLAASLVNPSCDERLCA